MEILTLLKANILHKKGSFMSVILLMAIVTLSFSVTVSNNDNISDGIERSFSAADTGDFAVFINESDVDEELTEKLTADENVGRVRSDEAIACLSYTVNDTEGKSPYLLMKWENNYPVYDDRLKNFDNAPEELSDGEAYVPAALKTVYGCEKGSEIVINTKNGKEKFTVSGFIEEPFLGSMSIGIKDIFITENDYARLYSDSVDAENSPLRLMLPTSIIHIFRNENSTLSVNELKKELNRRYELIDKAMFTMSRENSENITTLFTDTGTKLLAVYVILLITIIMIAINHSISSTIETEYVSLGILKAQGFTKEKIRLIYALQYFFGLITGAVIGLVLSVPLTNILGKVFQPITGIMTATDISVGKCMLISLGIIVVCTIYIFFATKKISRISPVRAISGGAEEVHFDSMINIPIRQKPLPFFIAMRQITSDMRSYIGTSLIAALLVFFMITITLLADGATANTMIEAFGAFNGQVNAKLNGSTDKSMQDEIAASVRAIDTSASVTFSETAYLTIDDNELCCTVYNDPAILKSLLKGRAPLYENELMITELAADEIGKKMGDTVTVGGSRGSSEYVISGIYQSVQDMGKCFAMSFDAASVIGDISPSAIYVTLSDEALADKVVTELNDNYGDILEAKTTEKSGYAESMTDMIDTLMNVVTGVIYSVSAAFALVTVHMVCTKVFLRERKDVGIYKAIGFTSSGLRLQFAVRFLIVAAVGSAAGMVLALLFSDDILSILLKNIGISFFSVSCTITSVIVPFALICVCFFVLAFFASHKVKRVAVRELITE